MPCYMKNCNKPSIKHLIMHQQEYDETCKNNTELSSFLKNLTQYPPNKNLPGGVIGVTLCYDELKKLFTLVDNPSNGYGLTKGSNSYKAFIIRESNEEFKKEMISGEILSQELEKEELERAMKELIAGNQS